MRVKNDRKTKHNSILCMFSGGVDSTAVLHKMMTDPKYVNRRLLVHHIHMFNPENRALAEVYAVKKILTYYHENFPERKFNYSTSKFDITGFKALGSKRFTFDMDVCAFLAGNITAARPDVTEVAFGRTQTDIENGGDNFQKRILRAQDIYQSVLTLRPKEKRAKYIFPVVNYNKKHLYEQLPSEVQEMVWWCRRPRYENKIPKRCEKCRTCQEMKAVLALG